METPRALWAICRNGISDVLAKNSLEMQPFLENRICAAVDLLVLTYQIPALMKDLLLKSVELHSKVVFRPVSPIAIFPYSKMEATFRSVQGGDSIGKTVLRPELEDQVKVC